MMKKEYQMKDLGGLLVDSIITLQKLQMTVRNVDDKDRTIGVAISEVEHELHAISDILENEN